MESIKSAVLYIPKQVEFCSNTVSRAHSKTDILNSRFTRFNLFNKHGNPKMPFKAFVLKNTRS